MTVRYFVQIKQMSFYETALFIKEKIELNAEENNV
jgi:hypothetical protein